MCADQSHAIEVPAIWHNQKNMSESVWPYDHAREDSYNSEKALGEFRCFVVCPANPPAYWDEIFDLIKQVCEQIAKGMGVPLRCRRAVDIVSAGIIHPEIWRDIRAADLIIADITGCNGNVMFELGVASAWLDKERVIIIREERIDEPRLFDINPARQIGYTRSPQGFPKLASNLASLIQEGIARAPFEHEPRLELSLPVTLDLTREADCNTLWGPSGAHRRILNNDGLEFGSLYNFRYGWVTVANLIARKIRVRGEFRFSSPRQNTDYPPWMGVMLRSQGYFANSGHLAVLRANGEVAMTLEREGQHSDVDIAAIPDFDPMQSTFVPFEITMDEAHWGIRIGRVQHDTRISDLPFVFSQGRIVILGQFCWVCIRTLSVDIP